MKRISNNKGGLMTIDKLGLAEAITTAISDKGFESYEDTEMLVMQGLTGWGEEDLIEKAAEFGIDVDEFKE
tara:strand:+ start:448 stop:660 length:213 start_codon:yes stop_codon:yes gene_type:complete